MGTEREEALSQIEKLKKRLDEAEALRKEGIDIDTKPSEDIIKFTEFVNEWEFFKNLGDCKEFVQPFEIAGHKFSFSKPSTEDFIHIMKSYMKIVVEGASVDVVFGFQTEVYKICIKYLRYYSPAVEQAAGHSIPQKVDENKIDEIFANSFDNIFIAKYFFKYILFLNRKSSIFTNSVHSM